MNPLQIEVRNNGGFISAKFFVKDAKILFAHPEKMPLHFQKFVNLKDHKKTIIRCAEQIYLPHEIEKEIQLIYGINDFPCKSKTFATFY